MSSTRALIFDVFGTIVDWRSSVAREATKVFDDRGIETDPFDFADYWRSRYDPAMEMVRNGNRGYVALDDIHLENLDATLAFFGLSGRFDEPARKDLNTAWEKLDPWPDAVAGLTALREHRIIAPCSNGSIALMTRLARYGSLPWDCILGADLARNYKPDPSVYAACCKALRLSADQVMMVAAHNSDLAAARESGLQTAFIPRPTEHGPGQSTDIEATSDWDVIAGGMDELHKLLL